MQLFFLNNCCIFMKDFGLDLAFSIMFFICPGYDNLRSELMILGNINIVSDGQKTDDLVSLCSL